MQVRKSRFIRMGSKIGAGVIIGAVLAVVPLSPSSATHLTTITLSSASVPQGTANVVLNGLVNNDTDSPPTCYYGWKLSTTSGTLAGAVVQVPDGTLHNDAYTLTVNTAALAPGVYNVAVTSTWDNPPLCTNEGPETANATVTITGRNGAFQCSAYAARTQTKYQPANDAYNPCKDDLNYFAQLQPIAGLGNVGAVRAQTDQQPNVLNAAAPAPADYADAQAHVAGVNLLVSGVRIKTGALWTQASLNCTGAGMTVKKNTNGTVATVNLNGRSFSTTSGYLKIKILGVTIEINKVTTVGNNVTRQALVITKTPLLGPAIKIVVGEANVGWTGNPCQGVF